MSCSDNFIEYIGLENYKNLEKPPIKNFIDGILEFDKLTNIDIVRVYVNISNDELTYINEEDVYFSLIKIELNIEFIDNDKFGMMNIKNCTFYKSLILKNEHSSSNLHNFSDYLKIIKNNDGTYYFYMSIKSFMR